MKEAKIEKIKKLREYLLAQLSACNIEQLNAIPPGYSNNIIWNLGHMISAQQTICYARAGLPFIIDEQLVLLYASGTKPTSNVNASDADKIRSLFLATIDQLQQDAENNIFKIYTAIPGVKRVYGFDVLSIEDAFQYLLFHEGYHAGCIASLRKLV